MKHTRSIIRRIARHPGACSTFNKGACDCPHPRKMPGYVTFVTMMTIMWVANNTHTLFTNVYRRVALEGIGLR